MATAVVSDALAGAAGGRAGVAQKVLDRIATLIAFGRHRDQVPGLPGLALTGGGDHAAASSNPRP